MPLEGESGSLCPQQRSAPHLFSLPLSPFSPGWGVEEEVKAHALKLASHGYRVLIPDLYRGKIGVNAEEAHHCMSALDWPGAVEDCAGAAALLRSEGSSKVGATGFCMGGALVLATAVRCPGALSCTAPFYGVPSDKLADCSKVSCPVLGLYGAEDKAANFSDPATVDKLEASLKASGQPFELVRYEGVGHAFLNATADGIKRRAELGQGAHNEQVVAAAWEKLLGFFEAHLKA